MTNLIIVISVIFASACVEAHAPLAGEPAGVSSGKPEQKPQSSLAEWERALSHSSSLLATHPRNDGSARVDLLGGFQSATIVWRVEGGPVRRQCILDPHTLKRLLGGTP